jgi:[acyl-carrier-protein] S-malonyltransferase
MTIQGFSSIAAVFPGIGAQYTGMGAMLRDRHQVYRETLDEACDLLGEDFADVIFEPAQKERLRQQVMSQLAVLVTGVAMFRMYQAEVGVPVSHFAGHSLGEYTALCCAGALSLADTISLVRERGQLIREVAVGLDGTMMWVIDLDMAQVRSACAACRDEGLQVYPSAYDGPRQAAISGPTADVLEAARELEARGARVLPLRMEGPYHCPLMRPAAEKMAAVLADVSLQRPSQPVLSTVSGRAHEGGQQSAALLAEQLMAPVRWLEVAHALIEDCAGTAVEFGPGSVLSFLLEKTSKRIRPLPFDRLAGEGELAAALWAGEADFPGIVDRCLRVPVSTGTRAGAVSSCRDEVVVRYRELEQIRMRPGLGAEDIDEALVKVEAILTAKGLGERERWRQRHRVLDGKLWPHLTDEGVAISLPITPPEGGSRRCCGRAPVRRGLTIRCRTPSVPCCFCTT